jgi:putative flippase GtrA
MSRWHLTVAEPKSRRDKVRNLCAVPMRLMVFRYFLVGISGVVVETTLFLLFYQASGFLQDIRVMGVSVRTPLVNLLAFQISLTNCFLLHLRYTFCVKPHGLREWIGFYWRYGFLMYVQLLVGTVLLYLFIDVWGWLPVISKILQLGLVAPTSYLIQKYKIFLKKGIDQ